MLTDSQVVKGRYVNRQLGRNVKSYIMIVRYVNRQLGRNLDSKW